MNINKSINPFQPAASYRKQAGRRRALNINSAASANSASQRLQEKHLESAAKVNENTATTETQKEYRNAEANK